MVCTPETSKDVLLKLQDALTYGVCSDNVFMEVKTWQNLQVGSYLSEWSSQYHGKTVIGLLIALTFLLTYTTTLVKSSKLLRSNDRGRKPPIAPYWIPFLGNLLPFVWDPFTYCAEITCVSHLLTPTSAGKLEGT